MADTLSELLAGVTAYKQGAESATNQIVALTQSQANISNSDAALLQQTATDNSTIVAAKQAADYQTQLARVKAANAFHTNLNSSTEQITKYAAAADEAQRVKDEALASIAQKDSVGLFDDPFAYIINKFTINDDIAKHNAANAQLESANSRIQSMNVNTQTTVMTQNAISEPLTAASMAASTRIAAVEATLASHKAEQQGLSYNVAGIQAALNEKKETLGLQFQANNAMNTERQIGISLQNLALNQKEFAFKQAEYNDRRDDKLAQQQLGQSVVDTINRGRVALLGAGSELDDISGKMILTTLKGKAPLSVQMQKFYEAGEQAKLTGINIIGASPAQAASTLQSIPVQLNPTQGVIKDLIASSSQQVSAAIRGEATGVPSKDPALKGINPKDPIAVANALNSIAQQNLNAYARDIKPGDSSNPYQIASINNLALNSPTVAALPLVQKVFAPLIKNGVSLTDPKQIMTYVGNAVSDGTITHAQALELSTIYHVGVKTNLAMRNLPGFGLVPSLSYNAKVDTNPAGWNTSETVDLTKPDSISRALLKVQSYKLQEGMMRGQVSMTPKFNEFTRTHELDIPMGPSATFITDPNDPRIPAYRQYLADEAAQKAAQLKIREGK